MKLVLALGSNIGDRNNYLENAIAEISKFVTSITVSSFWETEPVGGPEQGAYLNAILICDCNLQPKEVLAKTQEIERMFGRERSIHWGPRTLDIDLIQFGDLQISSQTLTLPHPLAHQRKFVLGPWFEIDPEAELIGKGSVAELLALIN